ncbi:MAG: hypothetical protein ACRD2J_10050, partial [Thermoanaerobaculia bacterium]
MVATVTFEDEGTIATIEVTVAGANADASPWKSVKTKQVSRASTSAPWPASALTFDLPPTLAGGSTVTFSVRVTEVRGLASTASANLTVLADTAAPEILELTPAVETRYELGETVVAEARVRDLESGVAEVTFAIDGQVHRVTSSTSGGEGVRVFRSPQVTVTAKNVDTRVPIVATATDWQGNATSRSVEVIYVGVNDPTVPRGAWACPVDRAAYPAGTTVTIPLRVVATDDIAVTGVDFESPGGGSVAAVRAGATDVWEASLVVTMPAAGESLELTALVHDADPVHDVRLPIRLDAIAIDATVEDRVQAITASNVADWNGKSVLVRGAAARLVAQVPVSFENLLVLDGARIDTLGTTTTTERRVDLGISGVLYADCASAIDVTALGYLGGWGSNPDGSNTRNDDARGRVAGNVSDGGATAGASASHGGLGGGAATNAPYGSLVQPLDLGAGGGGAESCCTAGAAGGGAIAIRGGIDPDDPGRIVVAGSIRADGGSGLGRAGAGAGGSILLDAKQIILGAQAKITANGGDDDAAADGSSGGGGGRIAIRALERLDASESFGEVEARGGRNGAANGSASALDGGPGTIRIARPGAIDGTLIVSSFDARHPSTAHQTRPTPLGGADLRFDAVAVRDRALLRVDDPILVNGVADDPAAFAVEGVAVIVLRDHVPVVELTMTAPSLGGSIPRGGSLSVQYSAASAAGVGAVTSIWSPVAPDRRDVTPAYPLSVAPPAHSLSVPPDAPLGEATLRLRVEDRAERAVETEPVSFTIVENTPVEITRFDVSPAALELYPGATATVMVDARDDLEVATFTFVATVGGAEVKREVRSVNAGAVSGVVFTYAVPPATPGEQDLVLTILADDGFPGRPASERSATLAILPDTIAPVVTILEPASDQTFLEGSGNSIPIRATAVDAEVAVQSVTAAAEGGATVALTKAAGDEWFGTLPVPAVEGAESVSRTITVAATDYAANVTTTSVAILIEPLNDPNAPVVTWACPTAGGLFPAGYAVPLRVSAIGNATGDAANGVQKVEFFVGESAEGIAGTAVAGLANHYEATFAIPPDASGGQTFTVRAVVTNVAGSSEQATTSFTVVEGVVLSAGLTIDGTNAASYAGQTLIVSSGTVTIDATVEIAGLIVLDGAVVTHGASDSSAIQRLGLEGGIVFIACGGAIDVSGRGFRPGQTYPGATPPGSMSAGSHMG